MSADELAERELFGSSSSSDDDDEGVESDAVEDYGDFELLRGSRLPRGLSLHRGALDRETAKTLFEALSKVLEEQDGGGEEGGEDENRGGRQAFYFGSSSWPRWAVALSARTLSTLLQSGCWPRELAEREPLFDMAAVNSYGRSKSSSSGKEGGEGGGGGGGGRAREREDGSGGGLKQHVDLPRRFADGVAIYSLGADAVMQFEEVAAAAAAAPASSSSSSSEEEGEQQRNKSREREEEEAEGGERGGAVVACRLRDGDLLLLSGEARWGWTHGFGSGDHFFRGERIDRGGGAGLRIGVTLRKMRKDGSNE